MHVDVIFAHDSFEDFNIFGVTDLDDQGATPLLDVSMEYGKAILSDPDEMSGHAGGGVRSRSLFVHRVPVYGVTESLALKCIV
jgi:hypothetical protein